MNAPTKAEADVLDLESITRPAQQVAIQQGDALAANSPMGMMMAAMSQGASLEQVEKMMDLQDRWERKEAEKAYNAAFAAFKAEAVRIIKGRKVTDGPLRGKEYAELHDVVDAVTPALSRHGLSTAWKLTKDEPQWLEVTCTLKHTSGHSESVSMGGPPDAGGAKNALQARASTKSYLERYTLKAICGVAEGGDDSDGNHDGRDDDADQHEHISNQRDDAFREQIVNRGDIVHHARDRHADDVRVVIAERQLLKMKEQIAADVG